MSQDGKYQNWSNSGWINQKAAHNQIKQIYITTNYNPPKLKIGLTRRNKNIIMFYNKIYLSKGIQEFFHPFE